MRRISEGICLLALLDACLAWPDDLISLRKLPNSAILKNCRTRLGLDEEVSLGTIRNRHRVLAEWCGLAALFELDDTRQFSRFVPDAREKLRAIRPQLVARIELLHGPLG